MDDYPQSNNFGQTEFDSGNNTEWNQQDAAKRAASNHFQSVQNRQPNFNITNQMQQPVVSTEPQQLGNPSTDKHTGGGSSKGGLAKINNLYGAITGSPLIDTTSGAGSILSALGFL